VNADELAAETKTDRIVRLALAAGRHGDERDQAITEVIKLGKLALQNASERDAALAEVARLRGLCERAGISTEGGSDA
jgi:hypothetical protein